MARVNEPATEEASSHGASIGAQQSSRIRILLVTSQKIFETGLLALLAEVADFQVVGTASSAREALSLSTKVHPSVIIVDACMPDVSAAELIRRITSESAHTRVLSLCSDESWRAVINMFRAGAWGYMSKQRPFECMKTALRTLATGARFVDGTTGGQLAAAWCELRGSNTDVALASLSTRENEVFRLLVEGHNPHEISQSLYISRKTAETHRRSVYRKLKLRDTAELMKFAVRHQLVKP